MHWETLSKELKSKLKHDLDATFKPIAAQADSDNELLETEDEDLAE